MKEFVFTYPTKVYFGEDSLEKALSAECGRFGRTVMLAYQVQSPRVKQR